MKGNLLRTLRALLLSLKPEPWDVSYHTPYNTPSSFHEDHREGYRVTFEGSAYFVRFNYTDDEERLQILAGHSRGRDRSGNNPDVSFTKEHFGERQLLVVSPSLRRCNGILSVEPKPVGDFPARVLGTTDRFIIGFLDVALFPSLFRLCLAKMASIEQTKGQP